jgi:hypothetical protein
MDWAKGGDKAYIEWLCRGADVLLIQEAKDFRLARLLPDGWEALQDTRGEAEMGSAIAVRTATVEVRGFHLALGARPFINSRRVGLLPRYMAVGHLTWRPTGEHFTGISGHFPPGRFRPLQPGFEKALARVIGNHKNPVVGTDANQSVNALALRLGLHRTASGIVGLLSGPRMSDGRVRMWGMRHRLTDHPSVSAIVHL